MTTPEVMVRLIDGTEVSNYSDEWRRESLARYVSRLPRERRQEFYAGIKKQHGDAEAKQLIEDVRRVYHATVKACGA